MAVDIDTALGKFLEIKGDAEANLEKIITEQDARLNLIDRILIDVLGWDRFDISTEPHSDSGYTDYLLKIDGTPKFVVEAKRIGNVILDTLSESKKAYKVGGPALNSAATGIRQAAGYCLDHGPDFAALTTGVVWIAFSPFPRGDQSYKDSKAIVFPNFSAITEHFAAFHDLFSKAGVGERLYRLHLMREEGVSADTLDHFFQINNDADIRLIPKSQLAIDTDPIFREFFGELSGDSDRDMLLNCFVETSESRYADSSLTKIVASIAANVSQLDTGSGQELEDQISSALATGRGETVLLVGNKGAGKSTFTERFFKLTLDPAVRSNCLIIQVDLLEATGDVSNLGAWIANKLRIGIEAELYKGMTPTYEDLMGLYWKEYQEWRSSQHKHLYETDKNNFKIRFGDFLNSQINEDRHSYVLRMLQDAVSNRKLLPCLVFDNLDHHSEAFQEAVFQWAQSIRKSIDYTFVLMPITDRTIWRHSKAGPFQTYKSKLFYLPVPSAREVLQKRIEYLKLKSNKQKSPNNYFLSRGIRLSFENIKAFAACIEEIFINEDFVSRRISWLANHDIRRSLMLAQNVITSPFMSIDDLVKAYLTRGNNESLNISYRKFMQSLLQGDYNYFVSQNNAFVKNIFSFSQDFPTSPLVKLRILRFLIERAGDDISAGYLTTKQILTYFELMGASDDAVLSALKEILEYRLIEPFDASASEIGEVDRYAVTHSGRMHVEMALTDPIYLVQMSFDTPIRSSETISKLRELKSSDLDNKGWFELRRTFVEYCISEDERFFRIPLYDAYDEQRKFIGELKERWLREPGAKAVRSAPDYQPPELEDGAIVGRSEIRAVVKWYHGEKGYGFAVGPNSEEIFLHKKVLSKAGIDWVSEGDHIIGDASPALKGRLQLTHVYAHVLKEAVDRTDGLISGKISFYDRIKKFGFVNLAGRPEDAYFSRKAVSEEEIELITSGVSVKVALADGKKQGKLQTKRLFVVHDG
ncbi:cold shock domain-containing protein [Rhizobium laguerreae]|uniref:cold shock domain-containing protein n=1 Tax=Rhizobium laguerreae TaxID=1076926 RepID=UPI001C910E33|nr:cold shock domain-containing protein [Rhizobium laguerreae]MBY3182759.1 cold shock domain-containing protein [Rhizobium laguerreae]